ncbi:MAG: DedA family protein [Chloroflexota bacterium]|jgi:membrane protein DedA with SNARE-associated domain
MTDIPFDLISWFQDVYTLLNNNHGKALLILLLVEEVGVPLPLPGDLILAFVGYRGSLGEEGMWEAGFASVLGVQIGATTLYLLSRSFGRALLVRYGRYIWLDEQKLEKAQRWVQRHGPISVFVGRWLPGFRVATSAVAGAFQIPFPLFFLFVTLAAITWTVFWIMLGYTFGPSLVMLVDSLNRWVSYGLAVAILLGFLVLTIRRRWK